ncbi:MAG: hypothetical protein ACKVX7_17670 [Planctomycetota bacterium]
MSEAHTDVTQRGSALVVVLVVAIGLLATTLIAFQLNRAHSLTARTRYEALLAREIAQSAASHAFGLIKRGGMVEPVSGAGPLASWVDFSNGEYFYYSSFDKPSSVSTVRAWGRVAYAEKPSNCYVAPDSRAWDGSGWELKGLEVAIQATKYVPISPLFFGNGGIEAPAGGATVLADSDPQRPETWGTVSAPVSFQSTTIPFSASALNHPADFIVSAILPVPAVGQHPYSIALAQNMLSQHNFEAWFTNSAGVGRDPKSTVSPSPDGANYETVDKTSRNYAYPVDPHLPDVQTFAFDLWSKHKDNPLATKLTGGDLNGTYGTLANPRITFVTGELRIQDGETFEGAGILVIRDAFDPNVDVDNQPLQKASLIIRGAFRWTGLVIVVGWDPLIGVNSAGNGLIVGALFAEDNVKSNEEASLDSATVALKIVGIFRVLFSAEVFAEHAPIFDLLPEAEKKLISVRAIGQ